MACNLPLPEMQSVFTSDGGRCLVPLSEIGVSPWFLSAIVFFIQCGPLLFNVPSGCWGCLNPDFHVSADSSAKGIEGGVSGSPEAWGKGFDCRRKRDSAEPGLSPSLCPPERVLL